MSPQTARGRGLGWWTVITGAVASAVLAALGIHLLTSDPAEPDGGPDRQAGQATSSAGSSGPGQAARATSTRPDQTIPTQTIPTQTIPTQIIPTQTRPTHVNSVGSSRPDDRQAGDPLAGAVPDQTIQHILNQAGLTNVPLRIVSAARDTAWPALARDLHDGGWRAPRLQAYAVTAPGTNHIAPAVVDVTLIWAAVDQTGRRIDRQRSVVRLTRADATPWQLDSIR